MQVKNIAECFLQYFQPSLSYHLSLRSLFCLFLSGRFTVLHFYTHNMCQIIFKSTTAGIFTYKYDYNIQQKFINSLYALGNFICFFCYQKKKIFKKKPFRVSKSLDLVQVGHFCWAWAWSELFAKVLAGEEHANYPTSEELNATYQHLGETYMHII